MEIPLPFLEALKRINGIFVLADIPYQVTGGLAARIYGATRPLYDLDLEVRPADIEEVRLNVRPLITRDLYHLHDQHFDLNMMTLAMDEVPIDISVVEPVIVCSPGGVWQRCDARLETSVLVDLGGWSVPVVARDELVRYKSIIRRPTDLDDLRQLGQAV